jgi:hypothetical protein
MQTHRIAYFLLDTVRDESGNYIVLMAEEGRHGYITTGWKYSKDRAVAQKGVDQLNASIDLAPDEIQALIDASLETDDEKVPIPTQEIIRVFPRQTSHTPDDDMAFVGEPPLFRPPAKEVHISTTFSWDKEYALRLADAWAAYYPEVKVGGPAFETELTEFVPGRYLKRGITFTTRGCENSCPWCLVPQREGVLFEIKNFHEGWIIQDNNLLQASREHIQRVLAMLARQKHAAVFAGGLDTRLLDEWFAEQLKELRIEQAFLAADTESSLSPLKHALKLLTFLPRKKKRVYVLLGREPITKAVARLEKVWALGGMPHAQLYQPDDKEIEYTYEWKQLARIWSRPALMVGAHTVRAEQHSSLGFVGQLI